MATRKLIVFEHDSPLGNAPAHALFGRVHAGLRDAATPPRSFAEYQITLDRDGLPAGVTLHEKL
jgi:CRISPR-associated protein Csd2